MQLEWFEHRVKDSEAETYGLHYLVDRDSDRCYATIPNPRDGNIIYECNLRFNQPDNCYVSLEAAKAYCESAVEVHNIEMAKALMAYEPQEEKRPWWSWVARLINRNG